MIFSTRVLVWDFLLLGTSYFCRGAGSICSDFPYRDVGNAALSLTVCGPFSPLSVTSYCLQSHNMSIIATPRRKNPLRGMQWNFCVPLPWWCWWQPLWHKAICGLQAIKAHCVSSHFFSLQFTCTCSQLWGNYPFLPARIPLSLCCRGNTEITFALYPDLPPYSLGPQLTSTTQIPGGSQAIRAASKIKGLSPTVEVHLPWPGRLLVSWVLGLLAQVRNI